MEVGGKSQAFTALPLGKELEVPTELEAGWAVEPLWALGKRNPLALPGSEPSVFQPVTYSPY
jgi:hypothetical protein